MGEIAERLAPRGVAPRPKEGKRRNIVDVGGRRDNGGHLLCFGPIGSYGARRELVGYVRCERRTSHSLERGLGRHTASCPNWRKNSLATTGSRELPPGIVPRYIAPPPAGISPPRPFPLANVENRTLETKSEMSVYEMTEVISC